MNRPYGFGVGFDGVLGGVVRSRRFSLIRPSVRTGAPSPAGGRTRDVGGAVPYGGGGFVPRWGKDTGRRGRRPLRRGRVRCVRRLRSLSIPNSEFRIPNYPAGRREGQAPPLRRGRVRPTAGRRGRRPLRRRTGFPRLPIPHSEFRIPNYPAGRRGRRPLRGSPASAGRRLRSLSIPHSEFRIPNCPRSASRRGTPAARRGGW